MTRTTRTATATPVTSMTFEQWEATYRPIKNALDAHAAVDGYMFETFGKEIEAVQQYAAANPDVVWTLIVTDDDVEGNDGEEVSDTNWSIMSGFHWVNRMGYLITEVPFTATEAMPYLTVDY